MIEIALSCIQRGWYVFPCKGEDGKEPCIAGGWKNASNGENRVRAWWTRWPNASVAIATRQSGLFVLDCDHGLNNEADARSFLAQFPVTYAVRSARRDSFGIHAYYRGSGSPSIPWSKGETSGDIRCDTGYVMAAGNIRPDTGVVYDVLVDAEVAELPDVVKAFATPEAKRKSSLAANGKLAELLTFVEMIEWPHELSPDGTKIHVQCPFGDHEPGSASSTTLLIKDGWYCFVCKHSHCLGKRGYKLFLKEVLKSVWPNKKIVL